MPYRTALAAVFIEGFIFVFLAVTGVRTKIIRLIPKSVMLATSAGIGLYLAHIGLQKSEGLNVVTYDSATIVTLGESSALCMLCIMDIASATFKPTAAADAHRLAGTKCVSTHPGYRPAIDHLLTVPFLAQICAAPPLWHLKSSPEPLQAVSLSSKPLLSLFACKPLDAFLHMLPLSPPPFPQGHPDPPHLNPVLDPLPRSPHVHPPPSAAVLPTPFPH